MRDPLAKQDWIRITLMVAFSGYLFHQIYFKTDMLLKGEMGFAEMIADSQEMKLPSVTFCPANLASLSENNELGNMTEDYHNLPRIEDMLSIVSQKININKYDKLTFYMR